MISNLEIDTDEMRKINRKLAISLDNLPEELKFEDVSVNYSSSLNNIRGLNTNISNSIFSVNSSIKNVKTEVNTLLESSNNYINSLETADSNPLNPSKLPLDLPSSLGDVTVPKKFDYKNNNNTTSTSDYNGSLIGSMALGPKDKNGNINIPNGTPQGVTQVVDADGNSYMVVTSYKGEAGFIQVYDSTGKLVKCRKIQEKNHMGGIVYQNGYLAFPGAGGITTCSFEDFMSGGKCTFKKYEINHDSLEGTGKDTTGTAYIGIDSQGRLVVGSFHTSVSNSFNSAGNSPLSFYTMNENGEIDSTGNDNGDHTIIATGDVGTYHKTTKGGVTGEINGFYQLQGMCSQTVFGQEETIFTSSYWANQKNSYSSVIIANHDTNSNFTDNDIVFVNNNLPPGAEQITRLADGNYAILYEKNGQHRLDFVSADFFMQTSKKDYPDYHIYDSDGENWNQYSNQYMNQNGKFIDISNNKDDYSPNEIYIGSMAAPIGRLNELKDQIDGLKTNFSNTDLSDSLVCSMTGNINSNIATLTTQLNVLSEAVGELKKQIWDVTNQYKKTDESN